MQKYKIITLLNSFTVEEIKNFEDFLSCCYFNTRKKPLELFKILKKYRGTITEDNFPKEKIYQKVYNDSRSFNKNTFNDLTSQLLHLAEDFLYMEYSRNNHRRKEVFLTQKYSEKGFESLFENKVKQFKKLISSGESLDSEIFNDLYDVNVNTLNYHNSYHPIKRKPDYNFVLKSKINAFANLTNYYLLEFAGSYINMLVTKSIYTNEEIENDFEVFAKHIFEDEFIQKLKPYNDYPFLLDTYKKMVDMFIHLNNNHLYYDYKSDVTKYLEHFSFDEKNFHYSKLVSYCTLRLIKNPYDTEIRKELTGIAKEMILNKYYLTSRTQYLNILLFTIFLNNFVFQKDIEALKFLIDECIPLIEKTFRSTYENLTLSYIYFLDKNYSAALNSLQGVKSISARMNYTIKSLSIRLHYHLQNTEQVISEVESYLKMISSEPSTPKAKVAAESGFGKMMKRIILAESRKKVNDISYLNHLIQKNPNIANKDWLLEITNDYLEKNKKLKIAR
ncbi:MAG: hypothetical protein KBG21_01495 [Ignavibacteria bacterium]|nr:hypothetical protein [Ignavibacteria bacterium]